MFPLDFPLRALRGARRTGWVLDPFCGRGTTNYAARLRKFPSIGIDTNPVAVAIAKAKLASTTVEAVVGLAHEILGGPAPKDVPEGEFWVWAYHPHTLHEVCKLREGLIGRYSSEAAALRGLVLGVLHGPLSKTCDSYLSNQMPRTFASKPGYSVAFWRERGLKPRRVDTLGLIQRRAAMMFGVRPPDIESVILLGDARTMPDLGVRFSCIITSPPYYGMRTYRVDQWLRLWLLGGTPEVTYGDSNQISHSSHDAFCAELAAVWRSCARLAQPHARLSVRFGAISSVKSHPREIILRPVEEANAGWTVVSVRDAGKPHDQRRQASHMGVRGTKSAPVEELDLTCVLA